MTCRKSIVVWKLICCICSFEAGEVSAWKSTNRERGYHNSCRIVSSEGSSASHFPCAASFVLQVASTYSSVMAVSSCAGRSANSALRLGDRPRVAGHQGWRDLPVLADDQLVRALQHALPSLVVLAELCFALGSIEGQHQRADRNADIESVVRMHR